MDGVASIGVIGAALGATVGLHVGIGRLTRRLPLWLGRGAGSRSGMSGSAELGLAFLLALLRGAVWLMPIAAAAAVFEPVGRVGRSALDLARMALAMPLVDVGDRMLALRDVALLPVALAAIWMLSSLLVRALRAQLEAVTGGETGVTASLSVVARVLLVMLGSVLALQGFGVDLKGLALVASILGVGIGFGLQNIANNFVSGLLLALERPIQPGDWVRVGDFTGLVRRIGGRSTEIVTADGVSILVPNARFLESEVVNWSHRSPISRLAVMVGVEYGSDPRQVRALLLDAARAHPEVLADPRPEVRLAAFGDSALDFELLVWTRDPTRHLTVSSALRFAIESALRHAGIAIPFRQHDVHLRSPALEHALVAFVRHGLGDDEGARTLARRAGVEADDPALPRATWRDEPNDACAEIVPDHGPASWSEARLRAVAQRMRAEGGIPLRDRRWRFTLHRDCFVGREAVDWLVAHEGLGRAEAVALGQRLLVLGAVRHVLDEHPFRDALLFYRFGDDATQRGASPLAAAS